MRLTNFMFARAPIHKLALLYSADSIFKVLVPPSLRTADLYINKHTGCLSTPFFLKLLAVSLALFLLVSEAGLASYHARLLFVNTFLCRFFCCTPLGFRLVYALFQLYSRPSRFSLRRPVGGRSTILTKGPHFVNTLYSDFYVFFASLLDYCNKPAKPAINPVLTVHLLYGSVNTGSRNCGFRAA